MLFVPVDPVLNRVATVITRRALCSASGGDLWHRADLYQSAWGRRCASGWMMSGADRCTMQVLISPVVSCTSTSLSVAGSHPEA